MNDTLVQVLVVALFALTCGALTAAAFQERLAAAAVSLFVVSISVWVAWFAAAVSGLGDVDGFFYCVEDCTPVHYVSAVGFLAPPLLIALAAFAGIVVVGQRRRARRAQ